MQVDHFHYTPAIISLLLMFEAAHQLSGKRALSAKSLDYEEKLLLHKVHATGIAQIEYLYDGSEYHYQLLVTLQTLQILSYAKEHLAGNMSLDTFIVEDYILINSLRNNTYQ